MKWNLLDESGLLIAMIHQAMSLIYACPHLCNHVYILCPNFTIFCEQFQRANKSSFIHVSQYWPHVIDTPGITQQREV